MSFKKSLICLGLSALVFSSASMAAETSDTSSGTVDFTGSIVNTPCAITSANQNLKVTLGQVKASVFTKKGDSSTNQPFTIILSNCTVAADTPYTATVSFGGSSYDGGTSLLTGAGTDTSGAATATGVGIQILDSNNTPLTLDTATTPGVKITKTEMNLPFSARYISIADTVSPGLANGHADFTVSYN